MNNTLPHAVLGRDLVNDVDDRTWHCHLVCGSGPNAVLHFDGRKSVAGKKITLRVCELDRWVADSGWYWRGPA